MPLMTGLPPTAATARGRFPVKNGLIRKERTIDRALNIPKQHPKAANNRM